MRFGVITALLIVVFVLDTSAGHSTRATRLPAPVTLGGVGGVKLSLSPLEVGRIWALNSPLMIQDRGGSCGCGYAFLPICSGGMRGIATFYRQYGPLKLYGVWFWSGAKTDRGVGIGSTLDQLRGAYGQHLNPDSHLPGFEVLGRPQNGRRPAIAFRLAAGKVFSLGFGWRRALSSDDSQFTSVRCR